MVRRRYTHTSAENYRLACEICGEQFADTGTLGAIELHFDVMDDHDPENIRLITKWIGPGPEPERTAMNREQRRSYERTERRRVNRIRGKK